MCYQNGDFNRRTRNKAVKQKMDKEGDNCLFKNIFFNEKNIQFRPFLGKRDARDKLANNIR